ncbi:MAG TPA: PH domain-containing protein [Kiritimatiellia bacterium]|jgi:membrane protein YdbS with pleckstrin-like domain/DNA-directed RNA polymerase subunit RPC12/RpoP|nr:PH domain-containing protein [Lentisphaerota bacterium]HPC18618.1 PH domain-containing protein [Kiritimatiellia bacterium]
MPDIKFNCPHCKQSLEAPDDMRGQLIDCPSCSQAIEIPKPQRHSAAPPPIPPKLTRPCPYCSEEIQLTAVKCKHCGEFLDGRSPQVTSTLKQSQQWENDIWKGTPSYLYYLGHFIFGVILILFFGLGLLFIIYALLDRNTKQYTITSKRVMAKTGIISRHIGEVGIKDIRSINVNQGILERIFGVGTVEIASAGTAGVEVKFVGVSNPVHIRDLIRQQKDEIG